MADLTRTKCGRILRREKHMLNPITLTSVHMGSYKMLFSPFVRKTCDFVQISMGYHSEVFAFSKPPNFFNKMLHKINFKRWFR